MPTQKLPLLGLSKEELARVALDLGLPRFVGGQLADWLYKKGVTDFEAMTNLSRTAREALRERFAVGTRGPVETLRSVDGTEKYLFETRDGAVETVFIPDGERGTVCVSSQVGCKMGCSFCMTGRQGFHGNLSVADILTQIFGCPQRERLTNVVFMGQGGAFGQP